MLTQEQISGWDALNAALARVTEVFCAWGKWVADHWYLMVCALYRAHVGSLPGGAARSKRLKKKRYRIVMGWFDEYLRVECGE